MQSTNVFLSETPWELVEIINFDLRLTFDFW